MTEFQKLKERGNSFFQRKQFDQAIEWYTKAIKEDPTVHAIYTNRAAAFFNIAKIAESLADAEKSVELEPKWTKGHFRKGLCLMKLGKPREALATFIIGQRIEPGDSMIQQGIADARAAIAVLPQDHNEAKQKGNDAYNLSQYEEAIKWYTAALQDCPSDATEFQSMVLTNRAECYRQLSQDRSTIADCSSALEIRPENPKALIRRGLAYEREDKLKLALEDLKNGLNLAPSSKIASEGVMRLTKFLRQLEISS
mmetsp:Transcript_17070/g.23551  ORF Transcript_17070/g.23551 Transcript_17070/m.23551 type:complete len:254 (+) Transcript_17070:311-1072(+)|eukprot:CAMPEP_0196572942 /NCGR_PEP_ID=MMETSP1081-20130531/2904_1 /TAXON_ID=36882 /ORGANISM="Pyramimonas amylifera, Strain CCMP720" /LENGTH=253 /DNA_ID=CAMNT_0041890457 /DNA_START=295 /DNA_END=1056 /DNA_ORIENTATION=+